MATERAEWFANGFRAEKRAQHERGQQLDAEHGGGAEDILGLIRLSALGRRLVGLEPWPYAASEAAAGGHASGSKL
jgi:hypothetical protein